MRGFMLKNYRISDLDIFNALHNYVESCLYPYKARKETCFKKLGGKFGIMGRDDFNAIWKIYRDMRAPNKTSCLIKKVMDSFTLDEGLNVSKLEVEQEGYRPVIRFTYKGKRFRVTKIKRKIYVERVIGGILESEGKSALALEHQFNK